MDRRGGILVVGEMDGRSLSAITRELLGGARRVAEGCGGPVTLLVPGDEAVAREGLAHGADRACVVANALFAEQDAEFSAFLLETVCRELQPALCLLGQTDLGRDVAPRLAARLATGLCMDCVEVRFEGQSGCFLQTRPAYGGKAMAVMASRAGTMQVDTVRAKSMAPIAPGRSGNGEITVLADAFESYAPRVRRTGQSIQPAGGPKLEDAKVIVAGGGGLGGAEGFEALRELAEVLNGAVGATRVAVDEGWVPLSLEIGQTGKIVNPDLYIAVGVSGAAQHVTGCINSKTIVAINKDPDANIFRISDFGLVADYRTALPVVVETIRSLSR